MNEVEIRRITMTHPLLKSSFEDVLSIDEVRQPSKTPASFIYNTDPADKPGEHWVAVYYTRQGQFWYFDSLAQPPPTEFIIMYSPLIHWTMPVQSVFSNVCGQYCIYFLYLCARGLSWNQVNEEMARISDRDVHTFVSYM